MSCHGVINLNDGSISAKDDDKNYSVKSFKSGVVLYDKSVDLGMSTSGKATLYTSDKTTTLEFNELNESQNVSVSDNGKYCVTLLDSYDNMILSGTTLRVYDTETGKAVCEQYITADIANMIFIERIDEQDRPLPYNFTVQLRLYADELHLCRL